MADERPNIVVLFADDAGCANFGFQPKARSDMKRLRPPIDTIAHDGVRLSAAYLSGAVCSPSRAWWLERSKALESPVGQTPREAKRLWETQGGKRQ